MAIPKATLIVKNGSGVADLEQSLRSLADAPKREEFVLKVSGAPQPPFLRDLWLAMLVRASFDVASGVTLVAPGAMGWPDLDATDFKDDDTAALSLPYMEALQCGARILPERAPELALSAVNVRRHAALRRGGLLGVGGRFRSLVEFDPQEPDASVLGQSDDRSGRLEQLILEMMAMFEIGAVVRKVAPVAHGAKRHVIDFLRELHDNAYRYARGAAGVRSLGFKKHFYSREVALQRAEQLPSLRNFVNSISGATINLVEATVSDFGPGILAGFRGSEAAPAYADWPDELLIHTLIHKQLSGNLYDPNAGLGTVVALKAARSIGGHVTLRTGRFWFVLDPTVPGELDANGHERVEMQAVPGDHPFVHGTHWVLIYPDSPSG